MLALDLPAGQFPGGLTVAILLVCSGGSGSVASHLEKGNLTDMFYEDWSQSTIDGLRYRIVREEYQGVLQLAEGSTSEVLRTRALNHINYAAPTDWIRELMCAVPTLDKLLSTFEDTFKALRDIP